MSSPYAPEDSPSSEDEAMSPTLARYALMARMSANGRPTDSDMGNINGIAGDIHIVTDKIVAPVPWYKKAESLIWPAAEVGTRLIP